MDGQDKVMACLVISIILMISGLFYTSHLEQLAQIEKGAIYETCTKNYVD